MNSSNFQVTDVTESRFHFFTSLVSVFQLLCKGLCHSFSGMESKKTPKEVSRAFPGHQVSSSTTEADCTPHLFSALFPKPLRHIKQFINSLNIIHMSHTI
jgi:hypothetical protein